MRAKLVTAGVVALSLAVSAQQGPPPRSRGLFKDSRQALAMGRAQGRSHVSLVVAAKPGRTAAIVAEASRIGAEVRFRDDEVGYLRIRAPIDRAVSFAGSGDIESVAYDVDNSYPIRLSEQAAQDPPPSGPPPPAEAWPPRLGDYPLRSPYVPLADIDAEKFRSAQPTFDGRGVTIAVIDGHFDFLLPEFQTAYALDGKTMPKLADVINVADPRDDGEQVPQWVDMRTSAAARDRRIAIGERTYTVARDATYQVGIFSERRFNQSGNATYIDQDIDRNGNPKGDDGVFAVVWDRASNDVWVDTDRDGDFADEKAMTDYRIRGDLGVFGRDDPETPIRESVGFTVQTDPVNGFVSINVGIYQHSSGILGAVAGNKRPNARLDGIAPGARLVSVSWGMTTHGMIEALIASFKHPLVDLVVLEQSVAIASIPYTLADGRHPVSVVMQRLIDRYRKLVFIPGSNLPAFAYVAEDGLAPGAVSVGGYQSRESYRVNAGFVPEHADNLHWGALSHGPSTAGALKPDLLAPSGQMSTDPGYRKGGTVRGLFQLPAGYGIGSGTSTATPMAAGAAALVVSAAKQNKVEFDAVRLKAALTRSARYISRLPAHEQGHGLLQVGAAFEMLRRLSGAETIAIETTAPVRHRLSSLLSPPHQGPGLYEREGWRAGDRAERTVLVTRTSGPNTPVPFTLTWEGNDGTFSGPESVVLPLKTQVKVPITVHPKSEGAHSAVLRFDHASIPGPAHRMLSTVVVPFAFTAEKGFTVATEVTPPVPGDTSVFVDVPDGVSALTVSSAPGVRLSFISPTRDSWWRAPCPTEPEAGKLTCSIALPAPGVWEINLTSTAGRTFDPEAASPIKAKPIQITARIADVAMTATPPTMSAAGGSVTVEAQSRLAGIIGEVRTLALGSAFQRTSTIAAGEQQTFEITVPKGTTSLRARVNSVADTSADLDLYLLDCTAPPAAPPTPPKEEATGNKAPMMPDPLCGTRAKADDAGSGGQVEIANPAAGRWVVVIDAFAVPSGRTSFEYFDAFIHPMFGTLAAADATRERQPQERWTVQGHVWVAEQPVAPRQLFARIIATSSSVTQPVRVGEGFDLSAVRHLPVPVGSLDLVFEDPAQREKRGRLAPPPIDQNRTPAERR